MSLHRNAKLGLAGRYALVCAIEGGMTLKAAAAAFSVSPATAHRWWHRWLESGDEPRRTLSCLCDRSSRPHRSPRQLAPELAEAICACRLKTGWGRDWPPGPPASATRRCGRCCVGLGSPVLLGQRGSRPKATSVTARATCCTWTRASTHASTGPATASPVTDQARTGAIRTASTSCTRSSMTTPGSPTPRSTQTSALQPSSASASVRSPSTPRTGSPRSG
jgi:transposase-like protein